MWGSELNPDGGEVFTKNKNTCFTNLHSFYASDVELRWIPLAIEQSAKSSNSTLLALKAFNLNNLR